jgi:hypothetical protein
MKIKTKRGARRIRNQRVVCKRFVVTDYTGCSYITVGKWYEVIGYTKIGNPMIISDDSPVNVHIITGQPCSHLNRVGTWRYVTI